MNYTFIFTDGNCKNNGKSGAKAAFAAYFEDYPQFNTVKRLTGAKATNNKAELNGILYVLTCIKDNINDFKDRSVIIVTDSLYSIKCITQWYHSWTTNGWKNSKGREVLNKDLIKSILDISEFLRKTYNFQVFSYKHVKSHQKEPEDKTSRAWKLWYGNEHVDNSINEFLKN